MKRAGLAVGLMTLSVGAAIAGSTGDETFRGLRFGLDLTKQMPECPKTGTYYAFNVSRTCWQQLDECLEAPASAEGCGVPHSVRLLEAQNSDFDANADPHSDSEVFVEVDGQRRLTRIYFYVAPERFESTRRVLRSRFGSPTDE